MNDHRRRDGFASQASEAVNVQTLSTELTQKCFHVVKKWDFFFTQRTCFMKFLTKPGKWTEECITRTDSEKREFLKKKYKE